MKQPAVIFEDNHLIAVNKPSGMLSQGDETGDHTLIDWVKRYIKEKYNKQGNVFCGLIHRIDRPVSGLVLLAKTSKSLERMNKLFQTRLVSKKYYAIVQGIPDGESGELVHWLVKNHETNTTKLYNKESKDSKKAVLHYQLIGTENNESLIFVKPETGRPHQIRVQLASLGTPILGDLRYGAKLPLADASIALHSYSLSFIHPTKNEQVTIIAPNPGILPWNKFGSYLNFVP